MGGGEGSEVVKTTSNKDGILPFYHFLFLYERGVMPERCLKKLVRALWSLKLRWVAISPMVMSE